MRGRGYVVQTVVLVSIVAGAAAALLLRFAPRLLGAPVRRRARPGAESPARQRPVPRAAMIRPAPTAPGAPTALRAPEAVGAPVAAGAPTAPVPAATPIVAPARPVPATPRDVSKEPLSVAEAPNVVPEMPRSFPEAPRRAPKNNGARHFQDGTRITGRVHSNY